MFNDMPPFVDYNTGEPSQAENGRPNVNTDDTQYASASAGQRGSVTPGGFGAGNPLPQASPYSSVPPPFWTQYPATMAGWRVTPYVVFEAPPPATPSPLAWGNLLSAVDQGKGTSLPPVDKNPYPQVGIVGGPSWPAFGVEPPPAAQKLPEPDYSPIVPMSPTKVFNQIEDDVMGRSSPYNHDAQTTKRTGATSAGSSGNAGSAGNTQATQRPTYSRPDNWKPRSTLQALELMSLPSPGKDGSSPKGEAGREGTSSFRSIFCRSGLHWSLDAKERASVWNIRIPPREGLVVYPDGRNLERIELEESAFSPPMSRVRLMHPFLPWYIYVESPHSFITVIFILEFLFHDLQNPALSSDFWNDKLTEKDRRAVYSEFEKRTSGKGNFYSTRQGVKRIDFLRKRYMFKGLKRVGDDWKLKLNPAK